MLTNITFSIDPFLLKQARGKAATEHKVLNHLFREWIASYVRGNAPSPQYRSFIKRFDYASPGRKFTREELNER